jgi:fructokinase
MQQKNKSVVCFGEVLWDILPTGKVPGGAPMNVAYHLHQHHIETAIITRVGSDQLGMEIKQWFAEIGIDTTYIQVDPLTATGKVYATPDAKGNMNYEIAKPAAWDSITLDESVRSLVNQTGYFVYGSLASRSLVTRQTLLSLLESAAIKIMDINLRPPHFSKESLVKLMSKADILKLNEEELELVSTWFPGTRNKKDDIRRLSERFNINTIIITRGAAGALLYLNDNYYDHPGYQVTVVDTIGSGDAFLAGMIVKLIAGADPNESIDYAARLGAFVAGSKGGCPTYNTGEISHVIHKNQQA